MRYRHYAARHVSLARRQPTTRYGPVYAPHYEKRRDVASPRDRCACGRIGSALPTRFIAASPVSPAQAVHQPRAEGDAWATL